MALRKEPAEEQMDFEWEIELEIDPQHVWRCEQLVKLGFSDFEAFRISVSGSDWHQAEKYLKQGATHAEVVEILI